MPTDAEHKKPNTESSVPAGRSGASGEATHTLVGRGDFVCAGDHSIGVGNLVAGQGAQ